MDHPVVDRPSRDRLSERADGAEAAQRARLTRFLRWDLLAVVGGIALLEALHAALRLRQFRLVSFTLLGYVPVLLWSYRQASRGRILPALIGICAGVWLINVAVAYALPQALVITAMLAVWPVLVALPYLTGRALRLVMTGSTVAAALAVALAMRQPVEVLGPPAVTRAVFVVAVPALVGFSSLVLWQYSRRLNDTLEETRAANQALRESERRLEDKVQDRTRQLEEARDEALAATRAKSVFLASMSHELRTPLNAIIGFSELMEEMLALGQPVQLGDVKRVQGAGRHLLALINEVLDLSKIEAGRMDILVESYRVRQLVEEVIDLCRPLVRPTVRLEVELRNEPGQVRGDALRVRQALFNLLSNAAKFTEEGRICLAIERRDPWLYFTVTDTGIGMTADEQSQLFHSFSQGTSAGARKYGGTGLGLALAKRLGELMGGDITVESAPGKGATFTLRLPAQPGAAATGAEPP